MQNHSLNRDLTNGNISDDIIHLEGKLPTAFVSISLSKSWEWIRVLATRSPSSCRWPIPAASAVDTSTVFGIHIFRKGFPAA